MVEIKEEDIEIVNLDKPDHNIRYLYVHTHDGFSNELCKQLKQQILQDHEDAKKLREYQKDNWISIPRVDFDAMRDEIKELRKENDQLGSQLQNTAKYRQIVKRLEETIVEVSKGSIEALMLKEHNYDISQEVMEILQEILDGKK